MKRSEMLSLMQEQLSHFWIAPPDVKRDCVDQILSYMEHAGMFYCPVEELPGIGSLRTPKGWDEED